MLKSVQSFISALCDHIFTSTGLGRESVGDNDGLRYVVTDSVARDARVDMSFVKGVANMLVDTRKNDSDTLFM